MIDLLKKTSPDHPFRKGERTAVVTQEWAERVCEFAETGDDQLETNAYSNHRASLISEWNDDMEELHWVE